MKKELATDDDFTDNKIKGISATRGGKHLVFHIKDGRSLKDRISNKKPIKFLVRQADFDSMKNMIAWAEQEQA